ncbi:head-tail joining protein [Cereibacter azotoformans]|uniref:head-tail joining protein n=1 Tax=Cereibacter azotoformans TaxID=43057 RepID=UPI003B20C153
MSVLFEGMGATLTSLFGAPASYLPQGGPARDVHSIVREEQIEAEDPEGRIVLVMASTWRVRRDLVPELARRDRIRLADGRVYEVDQIWPPATPAADALTRCTLRKVAP